MQWPRQGDSSLKCFLYSPALNRSSSSIIVSPLATLAFKLCVVGDTGLKKRVGVVRFSLINVALLSPIAVGGSICGPLIALTLV